MVQPRGLPWTLLSMVIGAMFFAAVAAATPSVNVGMKAAFSGGPYLLELLETAAAENESAYFPLLDRIASGHFASAKCDADMYRIFLNVLVDDAHVTSPEALSTFNLALSLRSAAPRIEAHYQYYSTAVEPVIESDCRGWVLLDSKQYCTPKLDTFVAEALPSSQVKMLPFDRTLGSGKEAILYIDPTSDNFGDFHEILSKAARSLDLKYRVRYRRNEASTGQTLPVSGYGVELALKRTDYIVIDDREAAPGSTQNPVSPRDILDAEVGATELRPLSPNDISELGMKAASLIQNSDDPFNMLLELTQDFPRYSAFIAAHNVSSDFSLAHAQNQAHVIPSGANILWMNGVQLIERQVEPFSLVEMLRRERKLVKGLQDLGLSGKQAVSLLGHQALATAKEEDELPRFDWTDQIEHGRVIMWINDLENDVRYEGYPKSLTALLQRTIPGQMPPIGRNLFHLVVPVDFSNSNDIQFISHLVSIISRGAPLRCGLVPLTYSANAISQAKVAYYMFENYGVEAMLAYAMEISEADMITANEKPFQKVVAANEVLADGQIMSFSEVLTASSFVEQSELAHEWAARLKADTTVRPLFINGIAIPRDNNWMQTVSMRISEDLQTVQTGLLYGTLDEEKWIPGIFIENAATKRNVHITVDEKALRILDVNRLYGEYASFFDKTTVLDSYSESTKENWAVLTMFVDMTAKYGLELVLAALEFKRNNPAVRLELIHNPDDSAGASKVNAALKQQESTLKDIDDINQLTGIVKGAEGMAPDENSAADLSAVLNFAKIEAGKTTVVVNGRVIGPIDADDAFSADDFQRLLTYEQSHRILPVLSAMDDIGISDKLSNAIATAKVTSIMALSSTSDLPEGIFESAPALRSTLYESWNLSHATIESGNPEIASIHLVGLIDPVSEKGQKWIPIIEVLSELDGVYVKLILNPREKIGELPVKQFFRYVMDAKPSFDDAGRVRALKASFKTLPSEALLTVSMKVPPAWLVSPKESVQDLDNLKLSTVKTDIDATYELEHILIEGHSREGRGAAPRGAQLVLATEKDPMVTDTIIMANVGFFQFKANPGFYKIRLKEGRTADIYTIESIGAMGWEAVTGDEGAELALIDFQGTTLYPRLKRRPGMEQEDVLEKTSESPSESLVSKGLKMAEDFFGGIKTERLLNQEHADINIFSVASGHLYERMLNIMMVSVMRHTKHSVKFWFIEQFLSPSFKDFIPHLAQKYGFKYEMVTYKWPHWLRQQKEKQREIWGYKILFLDVLFPLSLDKVIFVDADQIVRTDLMDLVNLDLKGAPYGFTPMCDSRTEMEGFRFWKQGYWANYLRGRPYHISALYVVDLRRFRELAAGDRLRQQYHALSADPGSLSNLDQDLPNHMQFEIHIHSLPQEWLWCETWCSDASLAKARTIDLCNNPQTKEPKLDRARRQVPEWTVYDDEIAALDRRRKQETGEEIISDEASPAGGYQKDEGEARETNTKSRKLDGGGERGSGHTMDEL